jgi:hypothetical protein
MATASSPHISQGIQSTDDGAPDSVFKMGGNQVVVSGVEISGLSGLGKGMKRLKRVFWFTAIRFKARLRKPLGVGFDFKYDLRLRCSISAAQVRPHLPIKVLPGITGSHRDPNLTHRHPDLRANLQQLGADRGYLRLGQFSGFQA